MTIGERGAGGHEVLAHVIPEAGSDAGELADLVDLLRADLLELDVTTVEPLNEGEVPEDSKALLAAVGGWLAVNLGKEALRSVVERVAAWATRNGNSVELSLGGDVLKLTGVSRDQQERLIDEWLARKAASA
jgi:hypothetical protein